LLLTLHTNVLNVLAQFHVGIGNMFVNLYPQVSLVIFSYFVSSC